MLQQGGEYGYLYFSDPQTHPLNTSKEMPTTVRVYWVIIMNQTIQNQSANEIVKQSFLQSKKGRNWLQS